MRIPTVFIALALFFSVAHAAPPQILGEYFLDDPLLDAETVLRGEALDRLSWSRDAPAWPGDRPGSLRADYDSTLPPGLCGFTLPEAFDQDDAFAVGAAFVIDPEGYFADPDGFFQISWGVWNSATTGLERTGNLQSFATDTFELLEYDYFANVSPFFGGPFVSPTAFGVAAPEVPSFPFSGAFANAAFAFNVEVALPLGEPLFAVMEHRPDLDAAVVTTYRIVGARELLPLPGAVALVPLDTMPRREYTLDTLGLTLWQDGFSGPTPALQAQVVFHSFVAQPGVLGNPRDLLRLPPTR